jgi:hypothetical protein
MGHEERGMMWVQDCEDKKPDQKDKKAKRTEWDHDKNPNRHKQIPNGMN